MSNNLFFGEIADVQIEFLAHHRKVLGAFLDGVPPNVPSPWLSRLLGRESPTPPQWPTAPVPVTDLNWGPECIHYVLNGTTEPVSGTANLMHGGNTPAIVIGDVGLGGASAYRSNHAKDLLSHFQKIPTALMLERLRSGGFVDESGASQGEEQLLLDDMDSLVALLRRAAENGNGVFWYLA
jgi:hypothetical protein